MQSLMPWVVSKLAFPLYHWIKRDGLLQAIRHLEASQWNSSEELRALQAQKLSRLLQHCENNVPFYSRLFQEMGRTAAELTDYEQFRRIPFLTKKTINENGETLRARGFPVADLIRNTTGGSTGEPLVFFNDRASLLQRQAVVVRNQAWVGALYSDREARLWGAPMDLDKLTSWRGRLHGMLHHTVQLSTYDLSDESMRRYVRVLNRFRPKLLISYPSPLASFSRFLIENNTGIPSIKSIITSAEMLFDWQRDLISKAFDGAVVYDRYGCREFGNIAHECAAHEGYHVNCERVFLEILDDEGNIAGSGRPGKLYVTDLDNMGFPFLRYEIGDMAVPSNARCSCGRGLPLIERFEGRSFDVVRCPNGNRVGGTFWTICLRRYKGIVRFQVVQERIDLIAIRLVVDEHYEQRTESLISAAIREKCGAGMQLRYEYVDKIGLTRGGKERLVISELQGA